MLTAAVIIGVVWGVTGWLESRAQSATEALGHIVRTYEAELVTTDEPPKTDEENPVPRFKTADERAQNVLKQLDELDSKHGGSAASKEGRLFRAGVLFDLGRIDEAAQSYEKFLGESKGSPMTTVSPAWAPRPATGQATLVRPSSRSSTSRVRSTSGASARTQPSDACSTRFPTAR